MKIQKTNAARFLDSLGIPYTMHKCEVSEDDLSAIYVAHAQNQDPERVLKTLVVRGDKTGVFMACIPAAKELDLKALARVSGNRSVALVHLKEVYGLTGYVRGGCSPLAAKKTYAVFIHEEAQLFDTIYISAGQRGVQLELSPSDLQKATNAVFADIIHTSL